ncbi:3'-5' exoribonuclease YhaM family protein [Desulfitobacterium sp.]|uniref:3'-5' exoribonuclease YhaM family protein n=1 Tax=Desulfitobacterium sp. TaxID=49981 RepID=UPI002CFF7C70|nr:HD domain-containing protein [Desulfitobacterium sp.]HVJ49229.1 HD domain-containing protein [Desulfitobacterium sp.]
MIKDLQKEQMVVGFFAVKEIIEKETRETKKKYLDLTLLDASGQINAKVWDIAEVVKGEPPQLGDIVKAEANVQEYRGNLQLKINKLRKITETDVYEPQTIIPTAPNPSEQMWATVIRFAEGITDKQLQAAALHILQKYKEQLLYYPAAKSYHHSYKGGLLQHISTMLLAAAKLTTIYSCNTDLLYAGIIVHDIGKLYELNTDSSGIGTEYTLEGEMLGHIPLGLAEIEHLSGLDRERKLLLQHMILSHHENPEWGSPKQPMLKEAELLHHLDVIDARMFDMNKAMEQTETGSLSPKIYSIDRKIYCPRI